MESTRDIGGSPFGELTHLQYGLYPERTLLVMVPEQENVFEK